ncbi:NADH-ubiquinone oxidoreductase subunit E family protein [Helicobacter pylori]
MKRFDLRPLKADIFERLEELIELVGQYLADAVTVIGSTNAVFGEVDR